MCPINEDIRRGDSEGRQALNDPLPQGATFTAEDGDYVSMFVRQYVISCISLLSIFVLLFSLVCGGRSLSVKNITCRSIALFGQPVK